MNFFYPFLLLIAFPFFSCKNSKEEKKLDITNIKTDTIKENNFVTKIQTDTTINIIFSEKNNIKIKIKVPDNKESIKGNILMLHGWDCPAEDWCNYTNFCDLALSEGYILIIPELGKSNYITQIYPETYFNLRKYPTLSWITDTMITELQNKYFLFISNQRNFVAGLSTGGRGATLLAYYLPNIIDAVASISGEFDITSQPDYYLYYAYLGKYKDFPERWEKECFAYDCKNYFVPTYIAHGFIDNIAPIKNSTDMYDSLIFYHPNINFKTNFNDTAKHNYNYWNIEGNNIINFFNEI